MKIKMYYTHILLYFTNTEIDIKIRFLKIVVFFGFDLSFEYIDTEITTFF